MNKKQKEKILSWAGYEYSHLDWWFIPNKGITKVNLDSLDVLIEIVARKCHSYNIVNNGLERWVDLYIPTAPNELKGLTAWHGSGDTLVEAIQAALLKLAEK